MTHLMNTSRRVAPSGRRLTKNSENYTYNTGYQLQSAGTDNFAYVADGRVKTINRNGQTLNLTMDNYDHLTSANGTNYAYDGEGRRVKATSGTTERRFLQASMGGLDVTELLTDGTGNIVSDYVYGAGTTPISRLAANGTAIYYLTDAMGSVIGEVDGTGNLVNSIQYDAFGNIRSQTGTARSDFRFQGQWLESDSGLYYFRARDYDPKSGLFLSRDAVEPIQEAPESANPYQFAYQNPNAYSDPSGMFTILEINASQSIESTLANTRSYVGYQAKEYVKQKIGDTFGKIVSSVFNSFILGFDYIGQPNLLVVPDFEEVILKTACEFFEGLPLLSYLRLFPKVNQTTGEASGGFRCSNYKDTQTTQILNNTPAGFSRPDFVFIEGNFQPRNPRSYLIVDFKTFQSGAVDAILNRGTPRVNNQWKAMSLYARNFQQLPFVSYISLFEQEVSNSDQKLIGRESINRRVITVLVSLVKS